MARRGCRVRDHCLSSNHPPVPSGPRPRGPGGPSAGDRREARGDRRAAAPDGGARPPRRRVEQGRRDHGEVRGRGRRRPRRVVHGWGARRRAQPAAPRGRGRAGRHAASTASTRWPPRPRALGVQHRWLGFVDSGLPEGDPLPPLPEGCFALVPLEEASAPLVELVREFRPHVITTYDPSGGYPHPDHIMCHRVSVGGVRGRRRPGALPPAAASRGRRRSSTTTTASRWRGCGRCTTRSSPPAASRRSATGSTPARPARSPSAR